jgi:hypothetical protein
MSAREQATNQPPPPVEKVIIKQELLKNAAGRQSTTAPRGRRHQSPGSSLNQTRGRLSSLSIRLPNRPTGANLQEVGETAATRFELKTDEKAKMSGAEVAKTVRKRRDTPDHATHRRRLSSETVANDETQRSRRPYSSAMFVGRRASHQLMLIRDSNIATLVEKANHALNIPTEGSSPWKDEYPIPQDESSRPLFSGYVQTAAAKVKDSQLRLTAMHLPLSGGRRSQGRGRHTTTHSSFSPPAESEKISKPPPYRPLLVMADAGDFLMGTETNNRRGDARLLRESRHEIDQRKFQEIRNKMLFQTINLKKKSQGMKEGSERSQNLLEIKKLIKFKKDSENRGKSDRWNYISFENSLPQNYDKFKVKKLNDLKKYLVSQGRAAMSDRESAGGIDGGETEQKRETGGQRLGTQPSFSMQDKDSCDFLNDHIVTTILKPYIQATILSKSKQEISDSKPELRNISKTPSSLPVNIRVADTGGAKKASADQKKGAGKMQTKGIMIGALKGKSRAEIQKQEPIILSDRNEEDNSANMSYVEGGPHPQMSIDPNTSQGFSGKGARERLLSGPFSGNPRSDNMQKIKGQPDSPTTPNPSDGLQRFGQDPKKGSETEKPSKTEPRSFEKDDQKGDSVDDLDINEIYEVEEFLERLKAFFLGYYRHKAGSLLSFLRDTETKKTVAIIKRLTAVSKDKQSRLWLSRLQQAHDRRRARALAPAEEGGRHPKLGPLLRQVQAPPVI